jgi:uracil-DNA glycosylase family protein
MTAGRRRDVDLPTAAPFVPATDDLEVLRQAAAGCRGCHLYEKATQTVFGRGPNDARLMLVGEQPGDVEDREGRPFVGPAGHLLARALDDAGVDRSTVWVTNAVKHFRFTVRGRRRIHATPDTYEVSACKPWLDAELALLRPEVVVLLGATAAKAVFGPSFRVTQSRGVPLPWPSADAPDGDRDGSGRVAVATIHPSAVLRAGDARESAYQGLVSDLKVVGTVLH